jgi:hypothetical protein
MAQNSQWYDTPDGKRRLQLEHEAIARFNQPRPEHLRLKGRRHRKGRHLIVDYRFQPLESKPEFTVAGSILLSARHPEIEPVAKVTEPLLSSGKHLILGEALRSMALDRSVPLDWVRDGAGVVLCMWTHDQGRDSWNPTLTIPAVVLNIQSWFLNRLFHQATGRWIYDEPRRQADGQPAPRRPARRRRRRTG